MPTFDSAWDPITDAGQITTTRWNDLFGDIRSFLENLDDSFFQAAAVQPTIMDGTAATLSDLSGGPTEQVITRASAITGKFRRDGTTIKNQKVEDAADLTPSVTNVLVMVIDNSQGSTKTITRLDDGQEGQEILLFLTGANDVVLTHQATGSADGEFFIGVGDITYTQSTDSFVSIQLRYTDLNGEFSNKFWIPVGPAETL